MAGLLAALLCIEDPNEHWLPDGTAVRYDPDTGRYQHHDDRIFSKGWQDISKATGRAMLMEAAAGERRRR
jgi:hypothetical protein